MPPPPFYYIDLITRAFLGVPSLHPIGLETLDPILESLDFLSSPFTNLIFLTTGIIFIFISIMSQPNYSTIEEITNEIISPEELAILNPMMPGQSNIPAHEGKNSAQILQEARKLQKGFMVYPMIEERPSSRPQQSREDTHEEEEEDKGCDPLNCHNMGMLKGFADALESSEDPLSTTILEYINQISLINSSKRKILKTKYTLLIRVSGGDWGQIKPEIVNSARCSYNTLYYTMEGMLKVFQLQHSKAINDHIVQLGDVTDNINTASRRMKKQAEMNETFNRDLSKQLNTLTNSIAQCMDKLDQKTLECHHPSKHSCHSKCL